jgi:hypothetical protein
VQVKEHSVERKSGRGLTLKQYPSICLEGLSKAMGNSIEDSPCPEGDLNRAPPEHKADVLLLDPASYRHYTTSRKVPVSVPD